MDQIQAIFLFFSTLIKCCKGLVRMFLRSVPKKVYQAQYIVYYYCAWYTFFLNRRYLFLKTPNLYNLVCFRMPKKQLKSIKGYCESTLFVETLVWVKAFNWPCSCNSHALLWVKEWKYTIGSDSLQSGNYIFPEHLFTKNFFIMCYLLFHLMNLQCFASLTKA